MPGEIEPGYQRVLVERKRDAALEDAAEKLLQGESPLNSDLFRSYRVDDLILDPHFGAVPIGAGGAGGGSFVKDSFDHKKSSKFLIRGFIRADMLDGHLNGEPIYSDLAIRTALIFPGPACGNTPYVGDTCSVSQKLGTATLGQYHLDGSNVAIAMIDTGIYRPHLERQLDPAPVHLDTSESWTPPTLATKPGCNRIGHGTMCAFCALIAAPKATLLDYPLLLNRVVGDHSAQGTVGGIIQGYWPLAYKWLFGSLGQRYSALVVNNSWGIFHPKLDLLPAHPGRFIDNPSHIFHRIVQGFTLLGADIIFAGANCGRECPNAVCLQNTVGTIMGANSYEEVLTLAGCDVNDQRVGYSSQGPSIPNMFQRKPDITAYTHFLGSKTFARYLPDTGTSTACAVASGCVAALRTQLSPSTTTAAQLFDALRRTAQDAGASGYDYDYGDGIIRPVAAAQRLNLIPSA
jgi:subtilisin family serine protease